MLCYIAHNIISFHVFIFCLPLRDVIRRLLLNYCILFFSAIPPPILEFPSSSSLSSMNKDSEREVAMSQCHQSVKYKQMSWNPEIKKRIIFRGRIIRVRHKGVQWGPVFDFIKQLTLKVRREKNHHVFPCFLRQKHFRAVIRHAQGSSPWGASIQRLALAIEVPQQSWWWEQAVSVSKYGEIFCAKILAGRVRNTVENFVGCDEGGFAVGRRHVWKPTDSSNGRYWF